MVSVFNILFLDGNHQKNQKGKDQSQGGGIPHVVVAKGLPVNIKHGRQGAIQRSAIGHDVGLNKETKTANGG